MGRQREQHVQQPWRPFESVLHLGNDEHGVLRGVVSKVAREVAKTPQGFEVGCDQNLDLARSPEARENVASRGPDGKLEMRPG